MNKQAFLNKFRDQILLLDGATGTNLQAAGMPTGVSPEQWILDNPEVLEKLQENFYEAGSTIVYAFTFGANRTKLLSHGHMADTKQVEAINKSLAKISCSVRDKMRAKYPERDFYVAGDLAPTGSFLQPAGELDFDELVDIYREQVRGMLEAGVDLFVAETMMDLAQTRAAVIAVSEETDLPVLASVTVDDNGRTLSGNSFEVCLLSLAAIGAQAVGMNCSSGPLNMVENMKFEYIPSDCLLLAKPNAGVPRLNKDGNTVFDLTPQDFASQMISFTELGVSLIGGCCGNTPEHISALSEAADITLGSISIRKSAPLGTILADEQLAQAVIASERSTSNLTCWGNSPLLECVDISTLAEDILDVMEDDPNSIAIKFSLKTTPERDEFKVAMAELQLTCGRPLIFITDDSVLQKWIGRYYHGLTAIITERLSPEIPVYHLMP